MADIPKQLKDITDFEAKEIVRSMVKQALHEELSPLLAQLKRIADALERKG